MSKFKINELSYADLELMISKLEKERKRILINIGKHTLGLNNLSEEENKKWIEHDKANYKETDLLFAICTDRWIEIRNNLIEPQKHLL